MGVLEGIVSFSPLSLLTIFVCICFYYLFLTFVKIYPEIDIIILKLHYLIFYIRPNHTNNNNDKSRIFGSTPLPRQHMENAFSFITYHEHLQRNPSHIIFVLKFMPKIRWLNLLIFKLKLKRTNNKPKVNEEHKHASSSPLENQRIVRNRGCIHQSKNN